MKPLFIPLKKPYFLAFADGSKRAEYRVYGPRWNERTCWPGRLATLSCGYSGARISARVASFRTVVSCESEALVEFFGKGITLAVIGMDL